MNTELGSRLLETTNAEDFDMDSEEDESQSSIPAYGYHSCYSYHSSGEEEEDEQDEDSDSSTDLTHHSSRSLLHAVKANDAVGVQQALRNGANVNASIDDYDDDDIPDTTSPLVTACKLGHDEIISILLDAGADPWLEPLNAWSAILDACAGEGGVSTIQLLLNHDHGLLEYEGDRGFTPLFVAISCQKSDIIRFLLDQGANVHATIERGLTALMLACQGEDLETMRSLLAAGVDVDARDQFQRTAMHHAVLGSRGSELMRELILVYNADMFALDNQKKTPFDSAAKTEFTSTFTADVVVYLLQLYGNLLKEAKGQLALHELLRDAVHEFTLDHLFHPPMYPLCISLRLGKLTMQHFRTLLHVLDTDLVRNRDDTGRLPIHIACATNAPVEVVALISELDPTTLQIADNSGSLPLHDCCAGVENDASVRHLVEQGGVGTLAARNRDGALPLHVLCGSNCPALRTVQYLIHGFPGAVNARTNDGQYPFMVAACKENSASLSVVYALVRAHPTGLTVLNH